MAQNFPQNIFDKDKAKVVPFAYLLSSYSKYEFALGSAIKNLGLFSKSPGDFRIEKMDFYSSIGRSTPGVLLPRLP